MFNKKTVKELNKQNTLVSQKKNLPIHLEGGIDGKKQTNKEISDVILIYKKIPIEKKALLT